ncbi:uncharacterized protein LOC129952480 [Eupeodes corollae]|uniref:uncharacterized protein LOC129952480 n=1 Tax=Eupeodes corollae TaxID=290404 RepID=UPI00248FF40B|nr:uncharacterized protein LOC129952480 [Eupeodes corollae]
MVCKTNTVTEIDLKLGVRTQSVKIDISTKAAYEFLGPTLETRDGALTHQEKMKICMGYVGDPGFQICVGEDIGANQSTISRVVQQVATKIASRATDWIIFPHTSEEIEEAQRLWSSKYEFPCALDYTHLSPRGERKPKNSINVKSTCNADEQFTSIQ